MITEKYHIRMDNQAITDNKIVEKELSQNLAVAPDRTHINVTLFQSWEWEKKWEAKTVTGQCSISTFEDLCR